MCVCVCVVGAFRKVSSLSLLKRNKRLSVWRVFHTLCARKISVWKNSPACCCCWQKKGVCDASPPFLCFFVWWSSNKKHKTKSRRTICGVMAFMVFSDVCGWILKWGLLLLNKKTTKTQPKAKVVLFPRSFLHFQKKERLLLLAGPRCPFFVCGWFLHTPHKKGIVNSQQQRINQASYTVLLLRWTNWMSHKKRQKRKTTTTTTTTKKSSPLPLSLKREGVEEEEKGGVLLWKNMSPSPHEAFWRKRKKRNKIIRKKTLLPPVGSKKHNGEHTGKQPRKTQTKRNGSVAFLSHRGAFLLLLLLCRVLRPRTKKWKY